MLRQYENNDLVKKTLLELTSKYEMYEWVQSELYQCLAISQQFTARELRTYYNGLKQPVSWYAKRNIYLLLLHHSQDRQFFKSILARAAQESEEPLRREVLFMAQLWEEKGVEREELLEAFGLA